MKKIFYVAWIAGLLVCSVQLALAQEAEPDLRFRNMERLIGKWVGKEEIRTGRTEPWVTGKSKWEVQWFPGGFVAQTSGSMTLEGDETSWIQVWGYDPAQDTVVSWYSDSNGALGSVNSSGWDGVTFLSNWTDIGPDGVTVVGRCSWKHSADFMTVDGTCEQFTDGIWWTFRKVEGTRSR